MFHVEQLTSERKRNHRQSRHTRPLLRLGDELFFKPAPLLVHLAPRNLFRRRIDKAQLAYGKVVVLIANRGPKRAALHWPRRIEVAGAGHWIEHRARLVVGELLEDLFMLRLREELAGCGIAWKS